VDETRVYGDLGEVHQGVEPLVRAVLVGWTRGDERPMVLVLATGARAAKWPERRTGDADIDAMTRDA
jgi:hypothetical protein